MADAPEFLYRWGAIPVPFVASWSSESKIRIAYDSLVRKPAVFRDGGRGEGKPMFGQMDESRVRRVVLRRLCQVCANPIGREGYVFDIAKGTLDGRHPVMNEPLACEACFRIALDLCPGIARQRGNARAFGARVRSYECVAAFLQPFGGGDAELNRALGEWRGGTPVGYVRCALRDYDVLDLMEFLGRASA